VGKSADYAGYRSAGEVGLSERKGIKSGSSGQWSVVSEIRNPVDISRSLRDFSRSERET
jgi:hypothetical protein